jgi:hypothetical protein
MPSSLKFCALEGHKGNVDYVKPPETVWDGSSPITLPAGAVIQPVVTLTIMQPVEVRPKDQKEKRPAVVQNSSIGDTTWLSSVTGWSLRTIRRLARQGVIQGCFRAASGSNWKFDKFKTLEWLRSKTR